MAEVVSRNGRKMSPVATRAVTPVKDETPKTVELDAKKQKRRAENEEYLKDKNVKAYLVTITRNTVMAGPRVLKPVNGRSLTSPPIRAPATAEKLRHRACIKSTLPHGGSTARRWD